MKVRKYARKSYAEPINDARESAKAISRLKVRDVYRAMYNEERREEEMDYMRTKSPMSCFYEGADPRRRIELADGGMVREDRQAPSNLPEQAIHCEYPQGGYFTTPYLDATVYEKD